MKTFLASAGFLALLVVVGTADSMMNKEEILANIGAEAGQAASDPVAPAPAPRAPDVAVPRAQGPDIESILADQGLTVVQSQTERTLLGQLGATIETRVLLSGNDRVGAIAWMTDENVKTIFAELKHALLGAFSPEVKDLTDQRVERQGYQTYSKLGFKDEKLGPENFLFVQFAETIIEMHYPDAEKQRFADLLNALTER